LRIPKETAWARIHRGNQLELGRKLSTATGSSNADPAGLERFPKSLEHAPVKFR
jgi:hypothetical protein